MASKVSLTESPGSPGGRCLPGRAADSTACLGAWPSNALPFLLPAEASAPAECWGVPVGAQGTPGPASLGVRWHLEPGRAIPGPTVLLRLLSSSQSEDTTVPPPGGWLWVVSRTAVMTVAIQVAGSRPGPSTCSPLHWALRNPRPSGCHSSVFPLWSSPWGGAFSCAALSPPSPTSHSSHVCSVTPGHQEEKVSWEYVWGAGQGGELQLPELRLGKQGHRCPEAEAERGRSRSVPSGPDGGWWSRRCLRGDMQNKCQGF